MGSHDDDDAWFGTVRSAKAVGVRCRHALRCCRKKKTHCSDKNPDMSNLAAAWQPVVGAMETGGTSTDPMAIAMTLSDMARAQAVYIAQHGDTFEGIALRHRMTFKQLQSLNRFYDWRRTAVHVGQKITVFKMPEEPSVAGRPDQTAESSLPTSEPTSEPMSEPTSEPTSEPISERFNDVTDLAITMDEDDDDDLSSQLRQLLVCLAAAIGQGMPSRSHQRIGMCMGICIGMCTEMRIGIRMAFLWACVQTCVYACVQTCV